MLQSLSAKGNRRTKRSTATTCAFTLSPYNVAAPFMVVMGRLQYSTLYSPACMEQQASEKGWGVVGGGRGPCSRAEGSLPSLIAVQFARCLYDGVREVEPAAEFTPLFLRHMRNPRSTPWPTPSPRRPGPLRYADDHAPAWLSLWAPMCVFRSVSRCTEGKCQVGLQSCSGIAHGGRRWERSRVNAGHTNTTGALFPPTGSKER